MTAIRFVSPFNPYFDGSGKLLDGGFIDVSNSGGGKCVSVFTDETAQFRSQNPVPLNGAGRALLWLDKGRYRAILKNKKRNQVAYFDPLIVDEFPQGTNYLFDKAYKINQRVKSTDSLFYVSLIDNNIGLLPQSNPSAWTLYSVIREWNDEERYGLRSVVQFNGLLYRSNTSTNQDNTPGVGSEWSLLARGAGKTKSGKLTLSGTGVSIVEVTGVGFEPRSLKVWGVIVEENAGNFVFSEQFGLPNLPRGDMLGRLLFSEDNSQTTEIKTASQSGNALYVAEIDEEASPSVGGSAVVTAFGSDGFTLTSVTNPGDEVTIIWTATDYGPGLKT